jgi:hypothetical protein
MHKKRAGDTGDDEIGSPETFKRLKRATNKIVP